MSSKKPEPEFKPIKSRAADHAEFKAMAAKERKRMQDFVRVLMDFYKKNKKGKAPAL